MHTPRCLQYRLNHSRLYYTTLDNVSQSLCFLPSCLFCVGATNLLRTSDWNSHYASCPNLLRFI